MLICAARRAALGIIFDSTYARIDKERIKDLVQRVPPDRPTAAWVTTLLATLTYYKDSISAETPEATLAQVYKFQEAYGLLREELKGKEKRSYIRWTPQLTLAHKTLLETIAESATLLIVDMARPVYVRGDASDDGWCFIIIQFDPRTGAPRVVRVCEGNFSAEQKTYKVCVRELLALTMAVRKMGRWLQCVECPDANLR